MEAQGIPTVTLTRADFVGVMTNAVAGLGLAYHGLSNFLRRRAQEDM